VGVSTAHADSFTTTGAQDYFFTLEQPQLFTVRTYAQQYGIDSMLWLYDSNNQILAANDDWFGLDSYITRNLDAGTYRLRTGVCCGDPNRWYGTSYVVDVNIAPSNAPSTTTTSSTTTTTSSTTTSSTTTSTTTTLPPLGMRTPTNLQAVAGHESVSLTWDAPEGGSGYAEVERYAVFFSSNNWQSSFAIASNTTSATVGNLTNGVTYQFRIRADNDTLGVYSSTIETYTVSATPQTTTTTSSVPQTTSTVSTTTTTLPPETSTSTSSTSTTTTEVSTTTTVTPTSTTTTTSSTTTSVPEVIVEVPTGTTTTVVEDPIPEVTIPEETTTTTEPEPETTVPETTTTEPSPETTVEETTTTTIPDEIITPEEVAAVVEELATITEITPEVLSEVVDALNSDNITEEQVQAIVDAVVENLDTLTEITPEVLDEVLNVLESDNITQEQVQEVVDTILATDISSDQATQLATSAAVLENITGEQATEIFATIDTGELTGEQAAAIVEAVQEAPTEVREAFEAEINVFEGGFDNYIPTDSVVSVGVRRVVVAATTVSFILPAPVVSRRRR
jgi:DNA-binding HxlR family transcriptional regulator